MVGGSDEPVIDNPESEEYNVPHIVDRFVHEATNYARGYLKTNSIMLVFGGDFNYMGAHTTFKNMDKLIKVVNQANRGLNLFYSTPSCYVKAVHDAKVNFTGKSDDYFPYASDPHAYWTGYFTSRPALKRFERIGNNWLQVCKQVDVFARNGGQFDANITRLREWMGVMQHHDAVSGGCG